MSVKYWEIIADNLSKAGWSWGWVSAIDSNDEGSGLLTHIAPIKAESWENCAELFGICSGDAPVIRN